MSTHRAVRHYLDEQAWFGATATSAEVAHLVSAESAMAPASRPRSRVLLRILGRLSHSVV